MLVEEVRRERLVAAPLIAAGADMELPSQYRLDVSLGLVEEGPKYDDETREWREAVGLPV